MNISSALRKAWTVLKEPAGIAALISIIMSLLALYLTVQNRSDFRAIEKLNLWPEIKLYTMLQKREGEPRSFTIANIGPVTAIQVEITLISHRLLEGKRLMSLWGSDETHWMDELPPNRSKRIILSDHFLDENSRIEKPLKYNAFEIRIIYRRPADLKVSVEVAYFLINPDGQWVPENENSLVPEIYNPIIEAITNQSKRHEFKLFHRDPLHLIFREK